MGKEGVEPSQPYGQRILSPSCMPFHHLPVYVKYLKSWRRESELNRRIRVLQTLALPLGYRAKIFYFLKERTTALTISSTSAKCPSPVAPQASLPLIGLIN